MKPLERGHKKLLNAWAFYDWANSVYSLTIVSTIFPIFYGLLFRIAKLTHIELFGMVIKSTSVIAFVTALAFAVVVVLSPILSGIADYLGNKKSFMRFFCYLGARVILVFLRTYLLRTLVLFLWRSRLLGEYRIL